MIFFLVACHRVLYHRVVCHCVACHRMVYHHVHNHHMVNHRIVNFHMASQHSDSVVVAADAVVVRGIPSSSFLGQLSNSPTLF